MYLRAEKFVIYPEHLFLSASTADVLAAWGLKNYDVSFVWHEIRTLIFKYIHRGDVVVVYDN